MTQITEHMQPIASMTLLQDESGTEQFFGELIASLEGGTSGLEALRAAPTETVPKPLSPVLAHVLETYAQSSSAFPSLYQSACTLWSNATGIHMRNVQSIGKLNTNSVHFIASKLCGCTLHLAANTGPAALKETVVSARLAVKFFAAMLGKLFDGGVSAATCSQ